MLTIRGEQMDALGEAAEERFTRRLAANLRADLAQQVEEFDDDELYRCVRSGVLRARAADVTMQSSVTIYVGLMFAAGPRFDEHPAIREILARLDGSTDARIEALPGALPGALLVEARTAAGDDPWADVLGGG